MLTTLLHSHGSPVSKKNKDKVNEGEPKDGEKPQRMMM